MTGKRWAKLMMDLPRFLRYHGGWLAPNIYYLGAAGSVVVNGIRISGASGIFKSFDYRLGEWEEGAKERRGKKGMGRGRKSVLM